MKIVSVVGARPQFIKAATVSRLLRDRDGVSEVLVHTGQHYDENMSHVFFEELSIPSPEYNLEIGSGPHGRQTGRMLEAIEAVLQKETPDFVLVYGDTNSTLAGALSASKLHIPIGHVEAGLRSFNRRMPEEINRVVTDHLSDVLFAPTTVAVQNLLREGIDESKIFQVGDVMYDAVRFYEASQVRAMSRLRENGLDVGSRYILCTIHRAENTGHAARLSEIMSALHAVSETIPVILPLHPRTKAVLRRLSLNGSGNLRIIEPVGYLEMLALEKNAILIVTDSGGVQKEAYFHRVPCVTIREETEWVELVDVGWNAVLGDDFSASNIAKTIETSLNTTPATDTTPLYGSGDAAPRIVEYICNFVTARN